MKKLFVFIMALTVLDELKGVPEIRPMDRLDAFYKYVTIVPVHAYDGEFLGYEDRVERPIF